MGGARHIKSPHIMFVYAYRQPKSGKTKIYDIMRKPTDEFIGEIKWDTGWRRYVLLPSTMTKWDIECLKDVQSKIRELMEDRR